MIRLISLSGLALIAATVSVPAQALLSLPLAPDSSIAPVRYACGGGREMAVRYISSSSSSLALITPDDHETLFVNVISASGARYVAGPWEWWSKGDTATLTNAMQPDVTLDCREAKD